MPQFDRAVVQRMKSREVIRCETALEQGDDALLLIPHGDDHASNGALLKLQALAEEIGVDRETLRKWRFVASRVPDVLRSTSATFSAYYEAACIADAGEREALLRLMLVPHVGTRSRRWTVDAVRVHLGQEQRHNDALDRALRTAPADRAAQAVADALTNPAVVEAYAAGAIAPDSAAARALETLNDRLVEQRFEEALELPTVPMAMVEDRVRQAQQESAPYQYDRLKQTLSAFFARYAAGEVAEAIIASPHTDRFDLYLEGADQVIGWFQQFRQALAAASRPRLVVPAESAS